LSRQRSDISQKQKQMTSKLLSILFCLLIPTVLTKADPAPAIIPLPQKMEVHSGTFDLAQKTQIYTDKASIEVGKFLAEQTKKVFRDQLKTRVHDSGVGPIQNAILLTTKNANTNLGNEGYELLVTNDSIVIRAPSQAGIFYGVQTLLQLLPPEALDAHGATKTNWQIPCVAIQDWPRFKWRGLMLDVSRHFFNKSEVKSLLDAMAMHKLNTFHWHLTDDQGWRIEIKKYPKLTEIGAWRPDVGFGFASNSTTAYGPDGRYGGFYTQDDIREVVKYATALHITIVPEIEMPGHSTAALAVFPQLGCTGGPFITLTNGGISNGIYNPANEETFQFLDNVIAEVGQLFPGQYIHIGGDEVPKETWKKSAPCQALIKREGLKNEEELQSWFIRRIEKIVTAHHHKLIGWSEILQGGIATNAAVMDWIGGAEEAANAGHDVVMSPTAYCYLDYYQSSNHTAEPRAAGWAPPLTLSKMYSFDPMPKNLPPELQPHILGLQGNLWTECVPSFKHAEYMIFPRSCALAEVAWSSKDARNWDDFMRRLQVQAQRFDRLGINYRRASIDTPESNPFN